MKSTIVKFNTLEELAIYIKKINPVGYRINTIDLSLSAPLSSFEVAIAVEQFDAQVGLQHAMA